MKIQTLAIYRDSNGRFANRRIQNAEYFQNIKQRNLKKQQEENIACLILTFKTLVIIMLICSLIKIISNLLGWA